MYPAVIDSYDAPTSVQEALQAFAQRGNDCHFIAGGQSLMQAIKARVISPKSLIDLQHVAELNGIEYKQGAVRIGAMTRYRDIAADERLDGALSGTSRRREPCRRSSSAQSRHDRGQPLLELYRRVHAADLHRYRSVA